MTLWNFLENYEIILAKFSSSCCYMLSFSFFFVVFIFCDVGQIVWCIKCLLSIFVSNPDRRVNIWELETIQSPELIHWSFIWPKEVEFTVLQRSIRKYSDGKYTKCFAESYYDIVFVDTSAFTAYFAFGLLYILLYEQSDHIEYKFIVISL